MKTVSRRSGFSLIELLTVIAIIAILAAIIFPTMSAVKERANQNNCMSNLQQIQTGLAMFKTDNRRYPEAIVPVVPNPIGGYYDFDNAKSGNGLYPEYVKGSGLVFRCRSSKITNKVDVVEYDFHPGDSSRKVAVYIYNPYDGFYTGAGSDPYEEHYRLSWARTIGEVASTPVPDDSPELQKQDFTRQLKFRNPPGDTVVTWCSWHETRGPGILRGKALVLFLDGDVQPIDAQTVETRKFRVRRP